MKKILFGLIALFTLAFTSCKDNAGLVEPGAPVDMAKMVSGVYEGTWTKTKVVSDGSTPPSENAEGTLTFSQRNDEFYVVVLDSSCPTFNLELSAPANINPAGVFFNVVPSEYGNKFAGKVTDCKEVEFSFNLYVASGRGGTTWHYEFQGVRK